MENSFTQEAQIISKEGFKNTKLEKRRVSVGKSMNFRKFIQRSPSRLREWGSDSYIDLKLTSLSGSLSFMDKGPTQGVPNIALLTLDANT